MRIENMQYSFTKPTKKTFIQYDTRVWLTFIITMTTIILAFNFLLQVKLSQKKEHIKINKQVEKKALANIESLKTKIAYMEKKSIIYNDIYISNNIFKESLKNLFDLIPEQIVLHSVILKDNDLYIKGRSPTKEIYNYLLDTPLKSIFNSSEVNFYLRRDGWYSFLSVNKFNKVENSEK